MRIIPLILTKIILLNLILIPQLTAHEKEITTAIKHFNQQCKQPSWQIWSHSLCGPLLFVEPASRKLYASHPDREGLLKQKNNLFIGSLPQNETIANTAKDWAGVRWSMIMLPLSADIEQSNHLITHESFHRIQPQINLQPTPSNNAHLAKLKARYLLLLELRALADAVSSFNSDQFNNSSQTSSSPQTSRSPQINNQAIQSALQFRQHRYQLYDQAEINEQALELNEGLAEYTAMTLTQSKSSLTSLIKKLNQANQKPSLERSFAYLTGAAYGLILDRLHKNRNWLKLIDKDFSFSQATQSFYQIKLLDKLAIDKLAQKYNGKALLHSEQEKERKKQQLLAKLTKQLVTGKTLTLPLKSMQMSFDPNKITSLKEYGKVYQSITLIDQWGKMVATNNLLIANNFKSANVSAEGLELTSSKTISTKNWTLTLNDNWTIVKKENGYSLKQR